MSTLYDMLDWGGEGNKPNKIVVHAMSEFFFINSETMTARDFLDGIKLSAHALVHPNGDITRCRADDQTAYHARGYNKNSLGIEFLVPGENSYAEFIDTLSTNWVSKAQYESGVELCNQWISDHGSQMVIRHSDLSPERKVDPGNGFYWEWFKKQINNGIKRGENVE